MNVDFIQKLQKKDHNSLVVNISLYIRKGCKKNPEKVWVLTKLGRGEVSKGKKTKPQVCKCVLFSEHAESCAYVIYSALRGGFI